MKRQRLKQLANIFKIHQNMEINCAIVEVKLSLRSVVL